MDGIKSNAGGFEYKMDDVNIASNWNPNSKEPEKMGGFNFGTEDKILRWLHRGDTIYDVEIPEDAEVVDIVESATPHGVFRTNKIILKNPRKITDDMALEFYKKSTIPEIAYYKTLAVVSTMKYEKTALAILRDKVNKENINEVLKEWNDFITHGSDPTWNRRNEIVDKIEERNK